MSALKDKNIHPGEESATVPATRLDSDSESQRDLQDMFATAKEQGVSAAFLAKSALLNQAIREIGMGRYQFELFFTAGFGWYADNIWLQGVAILLPSIAKNWEDAVHVKKVTLALYAGLICGATFWGCSADVFGRRFAWNCTLVIGGIFGLAAGAAPTFISLCVFVAFIGFGVGGNLPVDATLFIEFVPGTHQYLLTLLSVWWAIGQVVASLIAWGFLARWECVRVDDQYCTKDENMGWRYSFYTYGAMMLFLWVIRFAICPVYESPKFLASVGRDEEAIDVVHKVAKRNGKTSTLTVEELRMAAVPFLDAADDRSSLTAETKLTAVQRVKHSFSELSADNVKALFSTKQLAWATSLVILVYACVGLAFPLFNGFLGTYLAAQGKAFNQSLGSTYASYTYQAACGVPGSIIAALMVEYTPAGRKWGLSFFLIASGVFLFGLTQAKTYTQVQALTCMASLFENGFYGILFGYAPEIFPTPSRGTGDALAAAANRILGIFAPVIAIWSHAADTPNGPVFASASIFIVAGIIVLFFPIETRGTTAT